MLKLSFDSNLINLYYPFILLNFSPTSKFVTYLYTFSHSKNEISSWNLSKEKKKKNPILNNFPLYRSNYNILVIIPSELISLSSREQFSRRIYITLPISVWKTIATHGGSSPLQGQNPLQAMRTDVWWMQLWYSSRHGELYVRLSLPQRNVGLTTGHSWHLETKNARAVKRKLFHAQQFNSSWMYISPPILSRSSIFITLFPPRFRCFLPLHFCS